MAEALKIRKIGGSLGVIFPKSVLETLDVKEGDDLHVIPTPEGLALTPYDPDFADALEDARAFMRSHRDAFRELAK